MTVYITKTWGFSSPSGPLQFSQVGWRDRARAVLSSGDLVVIVGTMGEETAPENRGIILGLMEPSTEVVNSLDYNLERSERDYTVDGTYRWPFGLALRRAWRFLEPRIALREVSSRTFSMDAALGIVPLLPEEADRVLALPREEVGLLQPITVTARLEGEDTARKRGAPPPSTTRHGIMHMRRAPAFTYAMALHGSSPFGFKIGWAFDWRVRERQFNHASLPLLGGLKYRTVLYQLWKTARDAVCMEQSLLRYFEHFRHPQNPEVIVPIEEKTLRDAWLHYIAGRR